MALMGRMSTVSQLQFWLHTPLQLMRLEDVVSLWQWRKSPSHAPHANTWLCNRQHEGITCLLGVASPPWSSWGGVLWSCSWSGKQCFFHQRRLKHYFFCLCSLRGARGLCRSIGKSKGRAELFLPPLRKHYWFQCIISRPGPDTPDRAYGHCQVYVGCV